MPAVVEGYDWRYANYASVITNRGREPRILFQSEISSNGIRRRAAWLGHLVRRDWRAGKVGLAHGFNLATVERLDPLTMIFGTVNVLGHFPRSELQLWRCSNPCRGARQPRKADSVLSGPLFVRSAVAFAGWRAAEDAEFTIATFSPAEQAAVGKPILR